MMRILALEKCIHSPQVTMNLSSLWKHSLGDSDPDPDNLLVTVYFLACKILSLRPDELHRLIMKNFEINFNIHPHDRYMILVIYIETSSKNKQGGLKGINRKKKFVEQY